MTRLRFGAGLALVSLLLSPPGEAQYDRTRGQWLLKIAFKDVSGQAREVILSISGSPRDCTVASKEVGDNLERTNGFIWTADDNISTGFGEDFLLRNKREALYFGCFFSPPL